MLYWLPGRAPEANKVRSRGTFRVGSEKAAAQSRRFSVRVIFNVFRMRWLVGAEHKAVVGVFHNLSDAEASIKQLQRSGFDITKLSILGKDYRTEEHAVGYYNAGDRMKVWGKLGGFWGGLMGFMFGAAMPE